MPQSRKRKRKKSRPLAKKPKVIKSKRQDLLPKIKSKIKTWSIRTWTLIVSLSVVVTILSGLFVFVSRVNVSSATSLNPSEPFSTRFIVSNDGLFSIYDVEFGCSIGDVTFENKANLSNFTTIKPKLIPVIEAGEKATTNCPLADPQASKNSRADVAIVVSYKPRFLPYRKEKNFRFVSAQGSDGQWHWFPEPLSK